MATRGREAKMDTATPNSDQLTSSRQEQNNKVEYEESVKNARRFALCTQLVKNLLQKNEVVQLFDAKVQSDHVFHAAMTLCLEESGRLSLRETATTLLGILSTCPSTTLAHIAGQAGVVKCIRTYVLRETNLYSAESCDDLLLRACRYDKEEPPVDSPAANKPQWPGRSDKELDTLVRTLRSCCEKHPSSAASSSSSTSTSSGMSSQDSSSRSPPPPALARALSNPGSFVSANPEADFATFFGASATSFVSLSQMGGIPSPSGYLSASAVDVTRLLRDVCCNIMDSCPGVFHPLFTDLVQLAVYSNMPRMAKPLLGEPTLRLSPILGIPDLSDVALFYYYTGRAHIMLAEYAQAFRMLQLCFIPTIHAQPFHLDAYRCQHLAGIAASVDTNTALTPLESPSLRSCMARWFPDTTVLLRGVSDAVRHSSDAVCIALLHLSSQLLLPHQRQLARAVRSAASAARLRDLAKTYVAVPLADLASKTGMSPAEASRFMEVVLESGIVSGLVNEQAGVLEFSTDSSLDQLPALVQGLGPVLATASCAEGMCVDAAFNAQREMAIIHALDKRALRQ